MRYSFAAVLAFASAVLAQTAGFNVIRKPGEFENVPAGSTYTIVWDPSPQYTGTVTVSLIGGKDQKSLFPISTIGTAKSSDGKIEWKVADNLGDAAIYGITVTLDEDTSTFQWSFPFHIVGSGAGAGSEGPSASGTKSITASSNSTITKTSGSSFVTTTPSGNLSTTATGKLTTILSTTSTPAAATRTTASTTSSSTGAAPTNIGSTLALFGGLAMAVFAL